MLATRLYQICDNHLFFSSINAENQIVISGPDNKTNKLYDKFNLKAWTIVKKAFHKNP